jgi:glycosyltransferase involved in cell wall biosynthesis
MRASETTPTERVRIHIGVFAHNEQDGIAHVLEDLARQDLMVRADTDVRVFVLANGCTDGTVGAAREAIDRLPPQLGARFTVLDLPFSGKSRTWNHYVHGLCVGASDFIYCVDADIRIPVAENLSRMLDRLQAGKAVVVNSRPRKDIEVTPGKLKFIERLIVLASGTASDYRNSIAGSLYLVRTDAVADIHMPIGLPVEDGFLRAMLLTRLLTEDENFERIHGEPEIWHVYESLRTVPALVRHQTRLVIGSAINTVVFDHMRANARGVEQRSALLQAAAQDERWLAGVLRRTLPRWPSGFVPVHFLVNRLQGLRRRDMGAGRAVLLATVGFGFDALVYVNAQLQMARGKGAGHW